MSFSVAAADERVQSVEFSNDAMSVRLRDGRVISVPIVWYPRLLNATPAQRRNWRIAGGGYGIYWPDVDEDLSSEGLLRGAAAPWPHRASGQGLGSLKAGDLPSQQSWLSVGSTRPVQPSALDAAGVDAFQQSA
jgi:hypothetical protein